MSLVILFSLKVMELLKDEVAAPFWSNSIVFNKNSIISVIAMLMLTLSVHGP